MHLRASATPAIDHAAVLTEVPTDIDGDVRPIGTAPDVGADEASLDPPQPLVPWAYLPLVVRQ
jgi:hypothetical protein